MLSIAFRILVIYSVTYVTWRILKAVFSRSPLDNLPGPAPKSFWRGCFDQLLSLDAWAYHDELAKNYGGVVKLKGPVGTNQLYVYDTKAMYHIAVKDQYDYEEALNFVAGNEVIFGKGLLATMGEHHRRQRKMLNPVFSTAHMRHMVPMFHSVSLKLRDAFKRKTLNGPQEIDVIAWATRTALELIGQSGLGYSFDQLQDDEAEHKFGKSMKLLVPLNGKNLFYRHYLFPLVYNIGTPAFRRFVIDLIPWKDLHTMRDLVDIMHKTSVDIFESKKKALYAGDEDVTKQVGQGKDIISILLRENLAASDEDRLSDEELLGQMSTLTFAAMDTTSNAIARVLQLLSQHPDAQDKLRQEIREAREKYGEFGYDELISLPYLDAVCRETLRLNPPIATLMRETRRDVVLPFSKPIKGLDGSEMDQVLVPADTKMFVSIMACNRNPELWGPDALEWKPERWLAPLPGAVVDAHIPGIYSHLMTFFGGGRACIGFKFSQLELKSVISVLIENFRFAPSDKKVIWRMSSISSPAVEGNFQPQLPLVVSLVDPPKST